MPEASDWPIVCLVCKQEFKARRPILRVLNSPEVSMVVVIHTEVDVCPHCQQKYVAVIKSIEQGIHVSWIPYQEQRRSAIMAPTLEDVMEVNQTKGAIEILKPGGGGKPS